jgi:adenylosuccinate synthase
MARRGLRMCDLLEPEMFRKKAAHVVAEKNRLAKGAYGANMDFSHEVEETLKQGEKIRGYICDTAELVNHALDAGKSVLFEGAQGTMLDIDHGTYPFVTSSSATSGGAATGVGVPPTKLKHVLGISKAYTTRVGSGPFPTEMPDLDAQEVRARGKEFGAVTGRPRRCGWLDLQVLRYAKMINGIDSLVITKLDVFDTQREIQVCVGYKYKGTALKEMPALAEEYERVTPEYKTLPGWNESTYGLKDGAKLPKAAAEYLRFISEFLQVEIGMISTGPERDATIVPAGTLLASWL